MASAGQQPDVDAFRGAIEKLKSGLDDLAAQARPISVIAALQSYKQEASALELLGDMTDGELQAASQLYLKAAGYAMLVKLQREKD